MAVTAWEPNIRRAPGGSPASCPPPPHSSSPAMALLDGRYQLLRQLGGPARTPLMVASDLQTGDVVCIRLQRFSTAMATLTAVPALAPAPPAGDGPLLPRDFGVDEGTAYLVREFVTATDLQQLLDEASPPSPLEVVILLRRAGDALLAAAEQGFSHPGLALRHVLVTADGAVRVSGYDQLQRRRLACGAGAGEMLAQLVLAALPGASDAQPIVTARLAGAETPARRAPAVRELLLRCQTWQSTAPGLEDVVRALRLCEQQLLGYSRLGEAWRTGRHFAAALVRRCRHLGPLLHPYVAVLTLAIAIIAFAAHTLAAPADPSRLLVYAVPTRAPSNAATDYFFANPPQVLVTATATSTSPSVSAPIPPVATSIHAAETASATTVADATATRRVAPPTTARRLVSPPAAPPERIIRVVAATAPAHQAVTRAVTTTSAPPRGTTSLASPGNARSTVIVTRLTAQQTTARVTVIAATSEASSTATSQTARPLSTTSTRVTTASALHPPPATTRGVSTTTAAKTSAAAASSVLKQVTVLR